MRGDLTVFTAVLLLMCACERQRSEPVGFRVMLMPPCKPDAYRGATDYMGNSVALELHSFRNPTINGDTFEDGTWVGALEEVFSTRADKTLLIAPDPGVEMEQILTALDRLDKFRVVYRCVLLTPKQGKDIGDDSCVMVPSTLIREFHPNLR